MKSIIRFFAILTIAFISVSTQAQKLKFGHIDTQELLNQMPEKDSAEVAFNAYTSELEDILAGMNNELNAKYQQYLYPSAPLSAEKKQVLEEDIAAIQQKIEKYQVSAQEKLQLKNAELMEPILEKAKNAIEAVGKENGFIYIFDISAGVLLYNSEESIDIMPLVKVKLGITD